MPSPGDLVRNGVRVLRKEGPGAFGRAFALRFLGMQPVPKAFIPGAFFDFTAEDLALNREVMARFEALDRLDVKTVTWFQPVFSHPMAGINNIYTVARFLRERHGVENRWVFYGDPEKSEEDVRAIVARFFPDFAQDRIFRAQSGGDLAAVPETDASIATRWDSCYLALKHNRTRGKFYFVQDFEPLFYPAGVEHSLSEMTYRFGFARLCVTSSTYNATRAYPGPAMAFQQSVDPSWNRPAESKPDGPVRIVFYGRPTNPRNGFGLGLDALKKVKARYGDRVAIFSMGEPWDPRDYDAEGIIENKGVMKLQDLGDFYRGAHVGLGMIFTRHPSLAPLEYWANGVAVVTNDNEANRWIFHHEENCLLAPPSASMMADAIGRLVEDKPLRERLVKNGYASVAKTTWETESEKIWAFMTRAHKG